MAGDRAAPPEPGRFWMPPERSTLYGTPLWNNLTPEQQVELTKHEVVSAASAGVWFETVLMQMLIRHFDSWFWLSPPLVLPPGFQIWRMGTYMFLHGDPGHLVFNMLAVFMFGCSV